MDLSIKKNEHCIINLPSCGYVFNSQRSCFIGYGFNQSALEMDIIRSILNDKGIEPIEAGTTHSPGQYIFCTKICSKILTSMFCIILANNDKKASKEIPNANVNMEYGLMLGFNKYVIPFQREEQKLPFNIASLDTVKYSNQSFREKALQAIDQAIQATSQQPKVENTNDRTLETYLASKEYLFSPINDEGEKALFELGSNLNFNLLIHFSGLKYVYWGAFTRERVEIIAWRVKILSDVIKHRYISFAQRKELGLINDQQIAVLNKLFGSFKIWLLVQNENDKTKLQEYFTKVNIDLVEHIIPIKDIQAELDSIYKNFSIT